MPQIMRPLHIKFCSFSTPIRADIQIFQVLKTNGRYVGILYFWFLVYWDKAQFCITYLIINSNVDVPFCKRIIVMIKNRR